MTYYEPDHPYARQHDAGVHAHCRPATAKTRTVGGTGAVNACMLVMKHGPCVERIHSHDFPGPLWDACRCDDFAMEA